jgi:hypothetical protein
VQLAAFGSGAYVLKVCVTVAATGAHRESPVEGPVQFRAPRSDEHSSLLHLGVLLQLLTKATQQAEPLSCIVGHTPATATVVTATNIMNPQDLMLLLLFVFFFILFVFCCFTALYGQFG